ncbi:hypothetical protein [Kibdelosporangium philippinense]
MAHDDGGGVSRRQVLTTGSGLLAGFGLTTMVPGVAHGRSRPG